jgi:hypothetical protein
MTKKQKIFYVATFIAQFLITGMAILFFRLVLTEMFHVDYGITICVVLMYVLFLPVIGIHVGVLSYKITKKVILAPLLMVMSGIISVEVAILIMSSIDKLAIRIDHLMTFIYPNLFGYIAYVVPITALISSAISKLKEKKASKNA